jgi:hypothetical protein
MISKEDLQRAPTEYQEWGEKAKTSPRECIEALLPHCDADEITEILNTCEEVENFAWEIATEVYDNRLSQEAALERIRQRFDFMSEANVSHTFSQAMYDCLH